MKIGYSVALLILISLLPIAAGLPRVTELTLGVPVMDASESSANMPLSLIVHILTASVFLILGAIQLLPKSRRGSWHRYAGRVSVITGAIAAATGLWMTVLLDPSDSAGPLLAPMRAFFSVFWLVAIVLGVMAIRNKDIMRHRVWMLRSFAVGVGTAVQSLLLLPYFFIIGVPSGLPADIIILASWVLCLAVAEASHRRRPSQPQPA